MAISNGLQWNMADSAFGDFGSDFDWYDAGDIGGEYLSPDQGGYPGGIPGYDDYQQGTTGPVSPDQTPYDPYADEGPSQPNPNVVGKDETIPNAGNVDIVDKRMYNVGDENVFDPGTTYNAGNENVFNPGPTYNAGDENVFNPGPTYNAGDENVFNPGPTYNTGDENVFNPGTTYNAGDENVFNPGTPVTPVTPDNPVIIPRVPGVPVGPVGPVISTPVVQPPVVQPPVVQPPVVQPPVISTPVVRPPVVTPPPVTPPATQTGLGLNAGLITPGEFYKTFDPAQSKFFWGSHGYQVGPAFNEQAYNQAPAPETPWGLQQVAKPLTGQQIADLIAGKPMNVPSVQSAVRREAYNPESMITPSAANTYQVTGAVNPILMTAPTNTVTPTVSTDPAVAAQQTEIAKQLGSDWYTRQQQAAASGDWETYNRIQQAVNAIINPVVDRY